MKQAFVTGADRGLGFSLCEGLLRRGYRVWAGQYMPQWPELEGLLAQYPDRLGLTPLDVSSDASARAAGAALAAQTDHLDLLINCAGVTGKIADIRDGYDYPVMLNTININALGAVRMVEALLPLLDRGEDRKVCCISSEAGSIGKCWRVDETEYCMSKAALNMAMMVLYNRLKEDGYDFRLYHPGWMNTYMMGEKSTVADLEPETAAEMALDCFLTPRTSEKLVLESYDGTVWPW